MRSLIKCVAAFLLLCFTITASAQLQQAPAMDYLAREINSIPKEPANLPLRDTAFTFVRDTSFMQINTRMKAAANKFRQKTAGIADYVAANDFNTEFCFIVDMSIPSGKNRFFIYNIQKDSVEMTSLVSHGSGSYKPNCNDQLLFSNVPNSNCTSIGRYKIGNSYYGTYGLSYRLYGLDSSNNNAFSRAIVLHSDSYVPVKETYPRHIYESQGCPIVAPSVLSLLDKYIKKSTKPVLLWVYE